MTLTHLHIWLFNWPLKWVKTTKFLILRNGTRMSATNQHSSKWYPRLVYMRFLPLLLESKEVSHILYLIWIRPTIAKIFEVKWVHRRIEFAVILEWILLPQFNGFQWYSGEIFILLESVGDFTILSITVNNFHQNFKIHTLRCDLLYIHDEQVHRLA